MKEVILNSLQNAVLSAQHIDTGLWTGRYKAGPARDAAEAMKEQQVDRVMRAARVLRIRYRLDVDHRGEVC